MSKPKKPNTTTHTTSESKPGFAWEGWKLDAIAIIGFYAAMVVLFYPLFFLGMKTSLSPDSIAASSLSRATEMVLKDSALPLWNPYIFCGMPLFAAYHYGLFVNPIWYLVKPIGFLFGGEAAVIYFYLLIGAVGVYYVVREMGENRGLGFVSGLVWLWLPALIVLPDVGHGSKLMSSAVIPWMLWGTMRVTKYKGWHHVGILAIICGLSVLSLHTQLSYYGFMLVGWMGIWELICAIRDKKIPEGALKVGKIVLAVAIGVGISLVLVLPVLDFTSASSRGATGGGVDWEYATGWSFHPMESITFLWSTFFGSGGATYWGYMPFTDMPLTFGIVALIGAILAISLKRDRVTWMLLILAVVAWMVSWGKFAPILYKLFFDFIPMFKKFRVPSLILILTQLGMIVLAARGYGEVFRIALNSSEKQVALFKKVMIGGAVLLIAFFLLSAMMSTGMKASYVQHGMSMNPNVPAEQFNQAAEDMWSVAFGGGVRAFLILAAICALLYFIVKETIKPPVLIAALIVGVAIEFLPIINNNARPLVNFVDASEWDNYFAETGRVKFMKQQPGLFRVAPTEMQRNRAINWWSAFGLQNVRGYSGVKLANWDKFVKSEVLLNPNVLRALNVRYFATEQPVLDSLTMLKVAPMNQWREINQRAYQIDRFLLTPYFREVARDETGYLYELKGALPRAYFARRVESVADQEAAQEKMRESSWHGDDVTYVEKTAPAHSYDSLASASVTKYSPDRIEITTNRATPGVLVLAEVSAPFWKVNVNGQPADPLTVNAVMRGVAVPAGKATVEWVYTADQQFKKGLWLSLVSFVVALLIIAGGWWFNRRNRSEEVNV